MAEPRIGIIGGSGLYELPGLADIRWVRVRTPFGAPSDAYCVGRLGARELVFLPRHGRGHRIMPSELPFRANVYGLKALGVEWVISISAVGSMQEEIAPLDLVIPDQFYDHTRRRISSFFGDGIVAHVGMAEPVCPTLAHHLHRAAAATGARVHRGGTYLCIEGPQFSSKAESRIYRSWGVDVIGMTNMPEAKLAREAELCYATLALATDYDVWHESEEAVSVGGVIANLLKNVETAKDVIRRVVPAIGLPRTCPCPDLLKSAVITAPHAFPPATGKRLDLLLGKYFPAGPKGRRGAGDLPPMDVGEARGGPDGSADPRAAGRRRRDQIDAGTSPRGGQSKARTRRG